MGVAVIRVGWTVESCSWGFSRGQGLFWVSGYLCKVDWLLWGNFKPLPWFGNVIVVHWQMWEKWNQSLLITSRLPYWVTTSSQSNTNTHRWKALGIGMMWRCIPSRKRDAFSMHYESIHGAFYRILFSGSSLKQCNMFH